MAKSQIQLLVLCIVEGNATDRSIRENSDNDVSQFLIAYVTIVSILRIIFYLLNSVFLDFTRR